MRWLTVAGLMVMSCGPTISQQASAADTPNIQTVCPADSTGRHAIIFAPTFSTITDDDPYRCGLNNEMYVYQPAHFEDGVYMKEQVNLRIIPSLCHTQTRRIITTQAYGWLEAGEGIETARPTETLTKGFQHTREYGEIVELEKTPIQLREGFQAAYEMIENSPSCTWTQSAAKPKSVTQRVTDHTHTAVCKVDGTGVDMNVTETITNRDVSLPSESFALIKNKDGVIETFTDFVFLATNKTTDYGCDWLFMPLPETTP